MFGRHKGAAPRHHQGIVHRFGQIGEQLAHFLGRPETMIRRHAGALLVVNMRALSNTH